MLPQRGRYGLGDFTDYYGIGDERIEVEPCDVIYIRLLSYKRKRVLRELYPEALFYLEYKLFFR